MLSSEVIKIGALQKKSKYIGSWKTRWAILSAQYLSIYDSGNIYIRKETDKIQISTINAVTSTSDETFEIKNDHKYVFKTKTESEKIAWIDIINKYRSNFIKIPVIIQCNVYNDYNDNFDFLMPYDMNYAYSIHVLISDIMNYIQRKHVPLKFIAIKIKSNSFTGQELNYEQWMSSPFNVCDFDEIVIKTLGIHLMIEVDQDIKLIKPNNEKDNVYGSYLIIYSFISPIQRMLDSNIPSDILNIIYIFYDRWLRFDAGNIIDARDKTNGNWYRAQIKYYKKANQQMHETPFLDKQQLKEIDKLQSLEAIFIHYIGKEEKLDEWIFIDPYNTICSCSTICITQKTKHRLAPPNTQSNVNIDNEEEKITRSIYGTPNVPGCVGLVSLVNVRDRWLPKFETNAQIDCRNLSGRWCEAKIIYHKKANTRLGAVGYSLNKTQQANINKVNRLEGIFIRYAGTEERYVKDEWIFIQYKEMICQCHTVCTTKLHRLAPPNTQSEAVEGSLGFINSIIQCLSHIPQFRVFCIRYISNSSGMKSDLIKEIATLLNDIWCGDYKVIATESMMAILSHCKSRFGEWKQLDPEERLSHLFKGMHHDLNSVDGKQQIIDYQIKSDQLLADLSWNVYVKCNKSKIVDLFDAQQKSHIICSNCNYNRVLFDIYTYLSIPIVGCNEKSIIVDVFHRKNNNPINKPIRHIFHVNKHQKVNDLAKCVANHYKTKEKLVLFCEFWNMQISRRYHEKLPMGIVSNPENAIACYIMKDWNEEISPQEIKQKNLSLHLAKICHGQPLNNGTMQYSLGSNRLLFGMPFLISFLSTHTQRKLHQIIYQRLYNWVGSNILITPPTIQLQEDIDEYESIWNTIFELMPYNLLLFSMDINGSTVLKKIPIDNRVFLKSINAEDINIVIEWQSNAYNKVKHIVNKVVVDSEYSKWKREKISKEKNGNVDKVSLYKCIDRYVIEQKMDCSECKQHETVNKKIDLWSFPEILIIHLKRFQSFIVDEFKIFDKTSKFVDCPIRGLDLSKYGINKNNQIVPIYDLCAVSSHDGSSLYQDQYSSYVFNTEINRWYHFNGSVVKLAKQSDIISPSTYILFYKKRR